jgi:hypothetical protein
MSKSIKDRVVETRTVTPTRIASAIVGEDGFHWDVECEGGCGTLRGVAKRDWRPLDYTDPEGPAVCTEYTGPGAIRCISCGPFPTGGTCDVCGATGTDPHDPECSEA